jgi:hypothetical protein
MSQTSTSRCPFERIQNPDLEDKQITETTELTVKLLDKRYPLSEESLKFLSEHYPASIRTLRGVHPKSHGCVKATFTINPDIAPEYQVGLFAEPGKQFDAFIRFSNAAAVVGPDTNEKGEHGSRGMAIKVLDVGGEVLIDDNGAHNQDFLMINQPMFAFANTEDYLRLDKILFNLGDDMAKAFFAPDPSSSKEQKQRIKRSLEILGGIVTTDVGNPLEIQYFSAAPFLFGPDRVMKFSAKPCPEVVPPTKSPLPPRPDNYLRNALTETMNRNEPLQFDFMLQVRHEGEDFGKDNEFIENASTEWDKDLYPFKKVATITIPSPQPEIDTTENIAHCEKLAFTPWHSLVEHKPIGSINRLRKSVYQASAQHRLEQPESAVVRLLRKVFNLLFG